MGKLLDIGIKMQGGNPVEQSYALVGGTFQNVSSTLRNRIAVVDTNGKAINTPNFLQGFNGRVYDIKFVDDRIWVAGTFTLYQGNAVNQIVKLFNNGTIDTTFSTSTGFSSTTGTAIFSIGFTSDGKIIAGGTFNQYRGASIGQNIIRLNSDGTRDTTFSTGTGFVKSVLDYFGSVNKVIVNSDNKVLALGTYATYNLTAVRRICRLNTNGTLDTTFNSGGSGISTINLTTESIVNSMIKDGNDKIIIVGAFNKYVTSSGTTTCSSIIRLNADGSVDTTFSLTTGFNDQALAVAIGSSNKIIVGGRFSTYKGTTANRIVRINNDGTYDTTFATGSGVNGQTLATKTFNIYTNVFETARNGAIQTLSIDSSGNVLAAGVFNSYNGTGTTNIMRLSSTGTLDSTFVATIDTANNSAGAPLVIVAVNGIRIFPSSLRANDGDCFYVTLTGGASGRTYTLQDCDNLNTGYLSYTTRSLAPGETISGIGCVQEVWPAEGATITGPCGIVVESTSNTDVNNPCQIPTISSITESISDISIAWSNPALYGNFTVQFSTDNITWIDEYWSDTSVASPIVIPKPDGARYVRLYTYCNLNFRFVTSSSVLYTPTEITVNWQAELNCATASYSFRKNGVTQASGGGAVSDFGSFTCVVGDVLVAEMTSGSTGTFGCNFASSAIERNGAQVASDTNSGVNVNATSTWTVTAGTTSVQLYAGLIA
jgi:uncharacterized delta-60 repeat protein